MRAMKTQRLCSGALLTVAALSAVLMGGCLGLLDCLLPGPRAGIVQDVTVSQAHALIQDHQGDPNFILLDVRTPSEYASGHIEDAVNLCSTCSASFAEDLAPLDKTLTYLVYCRSGVRSARATATMAEVGFTNVYNMLGGILQWQAEGYPTVQPG